MNVEIYKKNYIHLFMLNVDRNPYNYDDDDDDDCVLKPISIGKNLSIDDNDNSLSFSI